MGDKRIDPKQQFSKKLAKWTAAFWFFYMTWLSVLLFIQPNVAQFVIYMALIATAVMILNVAAYTRNSIYEKSLLAFLDKAKIELNMQSAKQEKQTDPDDDYDDTEGDEDG